jgi:D-alanine-D-alanine ligase
LERITLLINGETVNLDSKKKKINIGVVFGGRSGEHEVSLMSARSILANLSSEKYNVTPIGITHEGIWYTGDHILDAFSKGHTRGLIRVVLMPEPGHKCLYAIHNAPGGQNLQPLTNLDVIFPILHGSFGEDGAPQGLFEMADMAYVGAGILGSAVGMDKGLFKDLLKEHGIKVPEFKVYTRREIETGMDTVLNSAETIADYPLFVKPANLGSSVGISKCHNRSDLAEGIMDAARYDRRILIERGLNAHEIEVSVLGNEEPIASVPGEISPSDEFYSYNAKYLNNLSRLSIPAPLPPQTVVKIQEMAVLVYKIIDCAGFARVDMFLDKDSDEVYVNEINTIPGFTQISMFPKLWEASGISYPELVDKLVELALQRKAENDKTLRKYVKG